MTEREKIIEVIKKAFEDCGRMLKEQIPRVLSGEIKKASDGTPPLDEAIADALIAAGIGDTTNLIVENKVLQRALLTTCVKLIEDEVDNVNAELLARVVYMKFLRKAEKRT